MSLAAASPAHHAPRMTPARLWHTAVVGACFVLFGAGGLLYTLLLIPALRLLPGGRAAGQRRVRALIRGSFRQLLALLQSTGVMRVEVRNAAGLRQDGPLLVLANHPCYLDIVALIAHIPGACCVVKGPVWANPFFGSVVRSAGYVRNDDPESVVQQCAERIAAGTPLVIFPEGTRSLPGEPLRFVRGAARVALQCDPAIVPVIVRCDPPALRRGGKWHDIPPGGFRLTLEVLPPTGVAALLAEGAAGAHPGARALTAALERFFTDHLENHGRPAA